MLQVGELGSWPIAISYVTGQYDPKNPSEFITWKDKPGFLMINIDMDPWDGNYHLAWSIIADGEFKFGFGDGYYHYASYTRTTPEVVEHWYQENSSSFIYSCVPGWGTFHGTLKSEERTDFNYIKFQQQCYEFDQGTSSVSGDIKSQGAEGTFEGIH